MTNPKGKFIINQGQITHILTKNGKEWKPMLFLKDDNDGETSAALFNINWRGYAKKGEEVQYRSLNCIIYGYKAKEFARQYCGGINNQAIARLEGDLEFVSLEKKEISKKNNDGSVYNQTVEQHSLQFIVKEFQFLDKNAIFQSVDNASLLGYTSNNKVSTKTTESNDTQNHEIEDDIPF